MKKQLILAALMLVSVGAFAQKKEIKKAEKALKNQNTVEALTYLKQAEGMLGSADNTLKAQFYVLKGEAYLNDAGTANFDKMKVAAESFAKAEELGVSAAYKEKLVIGKNNLRVALVNSAIEDQKSKNYAMASQKLYTSYMASKKDTADLYYSAGNAVNGGDYDTALTYYKQLLDIGFTGIQNQYVATDPEGEEVVFNDKNERDKAVLLAGYTNSADRQTESVKGDILQKITLIYLNKGENEKALEIIGEARAANPNDVNLIRSEADLAYKMGDVEKYNSLMEQVVQSDPNNPELFYNLGVSAAQIGDKEKAMGYYKKALEIDPGYSFAQINIAALMLEGEGKLVEEMNSLGMSAADEKRYDELKEQRKQLYMDVIPYLEGAVQNQSNNVEIVRTLMNIYGQVGEDEKFKAMKAKLQAMEGGK